MWNKNLLELVGNTPLIELKKINRGVPAKILVKAEYFNPGQSIKDRIAIKMVEDAERKGLLKPGGTIIEGTSGNTGMGLALVALAKGYRCIFTLADKQSKEKRDILKAVGAEVIVCPTNVAPEDPRSYYSVARKLAEEIPNSFYINQYDNLSNREAHYLSTGPEIWEQTEGTITHFVAGMGTCGTITGIAQYLKEQNPDIKVIGVDTYGSLFKKLHETGKIDPNEVYSYLTEGIGEDIVPENLKMELVDEIIKVTDKDGALMTRKLAQYEGLFVGWSSGSAVYAALEYARKNNLTSRDVVVVILPDHGTRYLGKVYNDEWMKEQGFLEEKSLLTAEDFIQNKTPLQSVSTEQNVGEALKIIKEQKAVPVAKNGKIVGTLIDEDLSDVLILNPSAIKEPVGNFMRPPLPFVLESTRADILQRMLAEGFPAVIVKANNELFLVSASEILEKFLM